MYDYKSQIKGIETALRKSPTAYAAGAAPSTKDIGMQIEKMRLKQRAETEEANRLREQWYPGEMKGEDREKSYLQKLLHTMGTPLYATVGAVESALGKGTKKGLLENIKANVEEEGTYGDLLRSYGMSNLLAMPLGFALDVAGDPLMWATAGTSAMVPRVGYGAIKAGPKGALLGAKSGSLLGLEKLGRFIPGLEKKAFPGLFMKATSKVDDVMKAERAVKGIPKAFRTLSKKSVVAREAYEELVGTGVEQMLKKSATVVRIPDRMRKSMQKSAFGKRVLRDFDYSSQQWQEYATKLDNEAIALAQSGDNVVDLSHLKGQDPSTAFIDGVVGGKRTIPKSIRESGNILNGKNQKIYRAADSASQYSNFTGTTKNITEEHKLIMNALYSKNVGELVKNTALSTKQAEKVIRVFSTAKVPIAKINEGFAKVLMSPAGANFFDGYLTFIGMFKTAKIGGNITAFANAMGGNLAMTAMSGIDVFDASFMRSMKKAITIMKGKDTNAIGSIFSSSDDWVRYMNRQALIPGGGSFKQIYGINPAFLKSAMNNTMDDFVRQVSKMDDTPKNAKEWDKIAQGFKKNQIKKTKEIAELYKGSSRITEAALAGDEVTSLIGEVFRGPFAHYMEGFRKGNATQRAFYKVAVGSMEAYSKIDQIWKLGTTLRLVQEGVDLKSLTTLAKRFAIGPDDVTQVVGRNLWKIKPEVAINIASEIYMNYLAMPAFVQAMRNIPFVGAPFAAFTYGMGSLMYKTALYNPSFYNKVQFLLKEISGDKSPLEKEALDSPYYSWFTKEGMVKLPFFQENPVYLNLANMLPHYTMNFFQPIERDYESKIGRTLSGILDKVPFFKTPEGQVLLDYVVMPQIIKEEQAKGMFGQPLWPKNASLTEKIARGSMALAESILPPSLGYAGLFMPKSEATKWIPHYNLRKLAFAKEGKSAIGLPTKEPGAQKALRTSLGMAGLPTYQMKLRYNK